MKNYYLVINFPTSPEIVTLDFTIYENCLVEYRIQCVKMADLMSYIDGSAQVRLYKQSAELDKADKLMKSFYLVSKSE